MQASDPLLSGLGGNSLLLPLAWSGVKRQLNKVGCCRRLRKRVMSVVPHKEEERERKGGRARGKSVVIGKGAKRKDLYRVKTGGVKKTKHVQIGCTTAVRIDVSDMGEYPQEALRACKDSAEFIKQVHVGNFPDEFRSNGPWKAQEKALRDSGVDVIIHTDVFNFSEVDHECEWLLDIPPRCYLSPVAVQRVLRQAALERNTGKTRWSVTTRLVLTNESWLPFFSFWHAMTMMLWCVNYIAGFWTFFWSTANGQDAVLSSIGEGPNGFCVFKDPRWLALPWRPTRAWPLSVKTRSAYVSINTPFRLSAKQGFFEQCKRQRNTTLLLWLVLLCFLLPGTVPYLSWSGAFNRVTEVTRLSAQTAFDRSQAHKSFTQAFEDNAKAETMTGRQSNLWFWIRYTMILLGLLPCLWVAFVWIDAPYALVHVLTFPFLWPFFLFLFPWGMYIASCPFDPSKFDKASPREELEDEARPEPFAGGAALKEE